MRAGRVLGCNARTSAWVACAALACSPAGADLVVDGRSDLVPGLELATIEVDVRAGGPDGVLVGDGRRSAQLGERYGQGVRLLELPQVAPGPLHVRARALDATGALLAEYETVHSHAGASIVTVLLRRCALAATCAECVSRDDCAPTAVCTEALCLEGACFDAPDDARCGRGSVCHPIDGCTYPRIDAGLADAGTDAGLDAGFDAGTDAGGCGSGPACPVDRACCGGMCVDLDADPLHCSACDRRCSDYRGSDCVGGTCGCGAGALCAFGDQCCDGACIPRDDFEHCYSCTRTCDPVRTDNCIGTLGNCVCRAAGGGFSQCDVGSRCCPTGCIPGAVTCP